MTKPFTSVLAGVVFVLAAGCKDKTPATLAVNDTVAKMTELRDKMCACRDAECARRVSDEMTAWSQQRKGKLSAEEQKRASELGIATGECMKKVSGIASPTPNPTPAGSAAAGGDGAATTSVEVGSGSAAAGSGESATGPAIQGLPQECLDYKAAIDKLATCEKITKQARETLVKAYMDSAPNWANLPESSKANMKVSCKAGAQSVLAVAKQHCGG